MHDRRAAEDGCKVVVRVHVERCMRVNVRFRSWEYVTAPPHVRAAVTGSFCDVIMTLAVDGYPTTVETVEHEVSVVEWFASAPVL